MQQHEYAHRQTYRHTHTRFDQMIQKDVTLQIAYTEIRQHIRSYTTRRAAECPGVGVMDKRKR